MCKAPDIDVPKAPPPVQTPKTPNMQQFGNPNPLAPLNAMSFSTIPGFLTGPGGVPNSALKLGTNMLMGGGSR